MSMVSDTSYEPLLQQLRKQYRLETSLLSLLKSCSIRDALLSNQESRQIIRRTEQVLSATARLLSECHRIYAPEARVLSVKAAPSTMISLLQHAEREQSVIEYLRVLQGFLEHVSSGYLVLHSLSQNLKLQHCERVTLINLKAISPLRGDISHVLPTLVHHEHGQSHSDSRENPALDVLQQAVVPQTMPGINSRT